MTRIAASQGPKLELQRISARPARSGAALRVHCASIFSGRKGATEEGKPGAAKVTKASDLKPEAAEDARPAEGLNALARLANVLLLNAASLREHRGAVHCLQCKGMGTCECRNCKGKGVLTGQKVQTHAVRRMVNQLESMVGATTAVMHDNDWRVSNRCSKCRGTGRCMCTSCQGSGRMGASASAKQ